MENTNKIIFPPTFVKNWSEVETTKRMTYRRLGKSEIYASLIGFGNV
jgi:hypothetical protein